MLCGALKRYLREGTKVERPPGLTSEEDEFIQAVRKGYKVRTAALSASYWIEGEEVNGLELFKRVKAKLEAQSQYRIWMGILKGHLNVAAETHPDRELAAAFRLAADRITEPAIRSWLRDLHNIPWEEGE